MTEQYSSLFFQFSILIATSWQLAAGQTGPSPANQGPPPSLGPTPCPTGNGDLPMLIPEGDSVCTIPIWTVGTTTNGYTPLGIPDGLGLHDPDPMSATVRLLVTHEVEVNQGYQYTVNSGQLSMTGARISYLDIDRETLAVTDAGLAYDTVYDCNGDIPTTTTFLGSPRTAAAQNSPGVQKPGFSRFCASVLIKSGSYGFSDDIFFGNEENGGRFDSVGGHIWALDVLSRELWEVPSLGRGAWENVAPLDTGSTDTIALVLTDDLRPFDFSTYDAFSATGLGLDLDSNPEAAPLYLYVGAKNAGGNFLQRNGLEGGKLYVLQVNGGLTRTPEDFNGYVTTATASWIEIQNESTGMPSADGLSGYDICGYPNQATLWTRAEQLGAFGFVRLESVRINPSNPSQVVFASTGEDRTTFANKADRVGTLYTVSTQFDASSNPTGAEITIIYDGDADPTRSLRSPDNLEWATDAFIYVQEDKASDFDANGARIFGNGAVNPNEAGIVRVDSQTGSTSRVANINRFAVLDPTTTGTPVDDDARELGAWESSGIIDVTQSFLTSSIKALCASIFLLNIQAHGINRQNRFNSDSRITDNDLVEGGQILVLCV